MENNRDSGTSHHHGDRTTWTSSLLLAWNDPVVTDQHLVLRQSRSENKTKSKANDPSNSVSLVMAGAICFKNLTSLRENQTWHAACQLTLSVLVDGLQCPNIDVSAFVTWTACCDLDLQNLIRLLVWLVNYSLSVSSKLYKVFMRYCGNSICRDEWMNKVDGQLKTMPWPTLSHGDGTTRCSS